MANLYNTLCVGNVRLNYETCDSTNLVAKDLIANSNPIEGTVISADNQTEGRGQFGNKWISEKGKNLTISVIIKPKFLPIPYQFYISKIVSISIIDALQEITNKEKYSIKWPNDIYYNNKKIGGILIENQISSNTIQHSVLGIGLNINQTIFNDGLNATSLNIIEGKKMDIAFFKNVLLKKLDIQYIKLKRENYLDIDNQYLDNFLGLGTNRDFIVNDKIYSAIVKGVDKQGNLLLLNNGKIEKFSFKTIEWIF